MIDNELIEFIERNFPKYAEDIKESLELLQSAVETAVDAIEDKSNEIFKRERDFKKSNEYREKSQKLYDLVVRIQESVENMEVDECNDEITEESDNQKNKQIPDYGKYLVDNNVVHTLYEDYTHKRPASFELQGRKVEVRDWKEMLIETANILVGIDKEIILGFPNNPKMNGKKIVYFSLDEDPTMRAPRKLKDLDIYIATNHSANHIRNMITNMLRQYKINLSEFKIFLKADYSELH